MPKSQSTVKTWSIAASIIGVHDGTINGNTTFRGFSIELDIGCIYHSDEIKLTYMMLWDIKRLSSRENIFRTLNLFLEIQIITMIHIY